MRTGTEKYICPFCYNRFTLDQVEYRVSHPKAPQSKDEKLSDYYDNAVNQGPIISRASGGLNRLKNRFVAPRSVQDSATGHPADVRICPHCHNPLPNFFDRIESHIISIIGGRGSGKTSYIAVLINEIKRQGYSLNLSLFPQDVGIYPNELTSLRYQKKYYDPLYNNLKEFGQTQDSERDVYPLIYELRSNKKQRGKKKNLFLVFYDTAGENLNQLNRMERMANFVTNSSGIIFLLDSFQVPKVAEELKKQGVSITAAQGGFHGVLDQLKQLLEKQERITMNQQSRTPMAMAFSKFDELIRQGLVPSDYELCHKSHHEDHGLYNGEEVETISEEIKSLLAEWGHQAFLEDTASVFRHHAFFGISAFGETPKGGRLTDVRPHRALDPLLWILDQLDFSLPKTKA